MFEKSGITLPPGRFSFDLSFLSGLLTQMDENAVRTYFAIPNESRLLKTTISLCPECLTHSPAAVFSERGKVFISKMCLEHGRSRALLENDEEYYFLSNHDKVGKRFANDRLYHIPDFESPCEKSSCGSGLPTQSEGYTDQISNKTCTLLVEVTNACNMACRVCYSDSRGNEILSLEDFEKYLENLITLKGGIDSVQITGGEASLHPNYWQMIDFLFRHSGVKKIYLPTNGINFVEEKQAARLAPYRSKVVVLLQFDGEKPETNRDLRDSHPINVRKRVIKNMNRHKIAMQLTMTISRTNLSEIGWVIRTGFDNPNIKVIALQPVTYSGRYLADVDPNGRVTMSDAIKAVVAETSLRMSRDEFVPIPCSHPNCGWITLFVRRFGFKKNIVPFVDLNQKKKEVSHKVLLSTSEIRKAMGTKTGLLQRVKVELGKRLVRSTDIFTIAVKPFMDRFNYDQDRVANCCHHLMSTEGKATSFCEYNALLRSQDSWESFRKLPS